MTEADVIDRICAAAIAGDYAVARLPKPDADRWHGCDRIGMTARPREAERP
jgi:hypothetical protein